MSDETMAATGEALTIMNPTSPTDELPHVSSGDRITACQMNELIDRVNELYQHIQDYTPAPAPPEIAQGPAVVLTAEEGGGGRPSTKYDGRLLEALGKKMIYDRTPLVLEVLEEVEEEEGTEFLFEHFGDIAESHNLTERFGENLKKKP